MGLQQRKRRLKPGPAEITLILLFLALMAFIFSGTLAVPQGDWREVAGEVVLVEQIQKATAVANTPFRLRVHYTFINNGEIHDGQWEGEWPESHSPNALPRDRWADLRRPGYPLTVYVDPEHPDRNSLHLAGNRYPVWWFRVSVGLCLLLFWFIFAVYPRWKARH